MRGSSVTVPFEDASSAGSAAGFAHAASAAEAAQCFPPPTVTLSRSLAISFAITLCLRL